MKNSSMMSTLCFDGTRRFTTSSILLARGASAAKLRAAPVKASLIEDFPTRVSEFKPTTVYSAVPEGEIARAVKAANITGLVSRNGGLGLIRFGLSIVRMISGTKMSKAWVRCTRKFVRFVYKLVVPIYHKPPRIRFTTWTNPATVGQNVNPAKWRELANRVVANGGPISSGFPKEIIAAIKRARKQDKRVFHVKFVVQYLKGASVLLMQAAGRHVLSDPRSIGPAVSRNRHGIPRCIPVSHRRAIMRGNAVVIRFWLSMFSIYRVIEYVGTLKLDTIKFGSGIPSSLPVQDVQDFLPLFFEWWAGITKSKAVKALAKGNSLLLELKGKGKFFPIFKSGSVNETGMGYLSTSVFGLLHTAWMWYLLMQATDSIVDRGRLTKTIGSSNLWGAFVAWSKATGGQFPVWIQALGDILKAAGWKYNPKFSLGKLGQKIEPAGKIRVFAMVDAWTQFVLRPLHFLVQVLLKTIREDGTFDQVSPGIALGVLVKRKREGTHGRQPLRMYSYDLSAATDCLPIWIQVCLLTTLVGSELANHWRVLLTERKYRLNSAKGPPQFLEYGVGQPMGALSSWVMLALTHHFIVQLAWKDVGGTGWCPYYYVLGDDVVLAHDALAKAYLNRMRSLGVKINESKSLISPNCVFEFAKKLYKFDENWTLIPVKELVAAQTELAVMIEIKRKYALSLANFVAIANFGMKARSSLTAQLHKMPARLRDLLVALRSPTGPDPMPFKDWIRLVSWDKVSKWERGPLPLRPILGALRKACYHLVAVNMYEVLNAEAKLTGRKPEVFVGSKSAGEWGMPRKLSSAWRYNPASPIERSNPWSLRRGGFDWLKPVSEETRSVWTEFSPFLAEAPAQAVAYLWANVYKADVSAKSTEIKWLISRGKRLLDMVDDLVGRSSPGYKSPIPEKFHWKEDFKDERVAENPRYGKVALIYEEYMKLRKDLFEIPGNVVAQHVGPVKSIHLRSVATWNTWQPIRGKAYITPAELQAKGRTAQLRRSLKLHP